MLATEKSFPFDAKSVNGSYDRTYVADDFARYFRAFISSGMFMKQSTNLQVIANDDMTVTIKAGDIIIEGYRYELTEDATVELTAADGTLSRIDRISITWSQEDRDIHFTVQEGTKSFEPVAPTCRRNADYKDYVTADVYIGAGVISISQANITDQRLNSEICGVATPFVNIDTTTIFNQFAGWLADIEASGGAEMQELISSYTTWISQLEYTTTQECNDLIEEMKDLLDNTTAGRLQLEIDELEDKNESQDEDIDDVFYGFRSKTTTFNSDGSITETADDGKKKHTVFNSDGSITETIETDMEILKTKTTTFNSDGSITEVIS